MTEKMVGESVLIHFTDREDTLISILKLGFFYSHQDTITFQKLFLDAGVDAIEPDDHAMVCFTTNPELNRFGRYGIAVDKEWALSKGARKVEYVKIGSPRYNQLLNTLRRSKPAPPPDGAGMLERLLFQEMAAHTASRRVLVFSKEYVDLLNDLKWVQVSSHECQNEWRIRNPFSLSGVQWRNPTSGRLNRNLPNVVNRQSSVNAAVRIFSADEQLRQMAFLTLPLNAVRYLIVPKGKRQSLHKKINGLPISEIEIIEM